MHAAQAEGQQRPVDGVAGHADQALDPALDQGLHKQALHLGTQAAGFERGVDLLPGGEDVALGPQVDLDPAHVGLVGDGPAHQLGDDGEADGPGGLGGLAG